MYHTREWIRNDDRVFFLEPKHKLYQWIEKLSQLLENLQILFIIDNTIADESLDKSRISNLRTTPGLLPMVVDIILLGIAEKSKKTCKDCICLVP